MSKKTYRFVGHSEEQKAQKLVSLLEVNKCPKDMLVDGNRDPDKAAKELDWAKRQKEWKESCKKTVEQDDAAYRFGKMVKTGKKDEYGIDILTFKGVVFEKDVDVSVDFSKMPKNDADYLSAKLANLTSQGLFVDVDVERAEKVKAEEEARKAKSEELKAKK